MKTLELHYQMIQFLIVHFRDRRGAAFAPLHLAEITVNRSPIQ